MRYLYSRIIHLIIAVESCYELNVCFEVEPLRGIVYRFFLRMIFEY